ASDSPLSTICKSRRHAATELKRTLKEPLVPSCETTSSISERKTSFSRSSRQMILAVFKSASSPTVVSTHETFKTSLTANELNRSPSTSKYATWRSSLSAPIQTLEPASSPGTRANLASCTPRSWPSSKALDRTPSSLIARQPHRSPSHRLLAVLRCPLPILRQLSSSAVQQQSRLCPPEHSR